jgi:LacI family transcriptional regulator
MVATIRDVARLAGVSPSTVSRAFGWPHLVSPETLDKVQAVASSVGYTPNKAARGLTTGRTRNIAILVPDLTNPFFPGVVKGAQLKATASDYSVFIADTEDWESELRLAQDLAPQVDGLILCSSQLTDEQLADLGSQTAVVLLNRTVDGTSSVSFDNGDGIRQAVLHLQALGHTTLAWIGGPANSWSSTIRAAAIRAETTAAGLELREFGPFPPRFEGGASAADLVVAAGASAVVAYNDLMALGVMRRLDARGFTVPDDISVVGIDGSLMGEIASPPLTSVALPLQRAGRACMNVLIRALEGREPESVELPVQLMVRGSTGPKLVPQPVSV